MIGETGEMRPEQTLEVAYIENNQRRAKEIIEQRIQTRSEDSKRPNSAKLVIGAEIQRLGRLIPQIEQLISDYKVEEVIDTDFVCDIIQYLNTVDKEPELVAEALEKLRRRNSGLPEAS